MQVENTRSPLKRAGKPNGQFKVYYGVHTDVDIQQLVKAFFAEKAL